MRAALRRTGAIPGLAVLVALLALLGSPGDAVGGDRALRTAVERGVPALELAARGAARGGGGPAAVQAQYDAARDLVEALRRVAPVSRACQPLLRAARAFADANVLQAEGVDRPAAAIVDLGATRAARARERLERVRARCRPGAAPTLEREQDLDEPRSGEASFGRVRAAVPPGPTSVALVVDGVRLATVPVRDGLAVVELGDLVAPGLHTISLESPAEREPSFRATSRRVWLLPRAARLLRPGGRPDRALGARLADAVSRFRGHAGVWIHDLATGATAGANADARFPAASTVKLGLLLAGLRAAGAAAADGPLAYDLAAMTTWSSNLATNRLLRAIGRGDAAAGAALAQAALAGVGATRSTFTGGYRVGTGARRPGAPPAISARVTTARDLGRVLAAVHGAALGRTAWLRRTGLRPQQARLALGWLLASQPRFENVGLLRPLLGTLPIAQKHGWFSVVRHTAGILYLPDGPRIVVVLTYADGLTRREATSLAATVLGAAGIRAA